ncbi:cation transporter [Arhodomonas sp. AD133]|uniref:cation transporter n=1 Tax=Arhodomonas sp. AD133 TaxID=3415009 RepID=UPI003EBF74BD
MAGCCHEDDCHLTALRQARTLWVVLIINASMFVAEFTAGWIADSTALLGDSLDMLGDALVYGFSLWVIARNTRWKAVAAGLKGTVMAVFGAAVLMEAASKVVWGGMPQPPIMALFGAIALAANSLCLLMLTRHRGDDVNMRSSWICSRNDLIANGAVLLAAAIVAVSASPWPDIIVGVAIAGLFLRSSGHVLADARRTYRASTPADNVTG